MAENSKIEWTDHTFNPWIGCTKISPDGCKNCYAEALVKRFGDDFAVRRRTSEANWKLPRKWNALAGREGRRFRKAVCSALAARLGRDPPLTGRLAVHVTVCPPDRRRRDLDNVQKALLDALEHGGVYRDDAQIDLLVVERGPVTPGGKSLVRVEVITQVRRAAE